MVQHFLLKFVIRWAVSTLGLWIAAAILGAERLSYGGSWSTVVIAGLFLAVVNVALKPIFIILSFPAIVLSLGIFMLVLNGFLIMIVHWIYGPFYVKNLGVAILAGIIVGLVNFMVTKVLEDI
jgi:putative membrane protein